MPFRYITILSVPLISHHILHIAIHEAGFMLAAFLTIMTLISHSKTKIIRMLFSSSAFSVLAFGQAAYMISKWRFIEQNT